MIHAWKRYLSFLPIKVRYVDIESNFCLETDCGLLKITQKEEQI